MGIFGPKPITLPGTNGRVGHISSPAGCGDLFPESQRRGRSVLLEKSGVVSAIEDASRR
jgi:hypothetical protein